MLEGLVVGLAFHLTGVQRGSCLPAVQSNGVGRIGRGKAFPLRFGVGRNPRAKAGVLAACDTLPPQSANTS